MKRIHCEIRGKVQNSGFRDFCWRCSRKAGITGWAANDIRDPGHVILEAQGEEEQLEKFFSLLLKGDGRWRIDAIEKTQTQTDPEEKAFCARPAAQ